MIVLHLCVLGLSAVLLTASTCLSLPTAPLRSLLPPSLSSFTSQPTAHVFLIAGQSNSVGYNSDPFTADDSLNSRILQLSCCTANLTTLPVDHCFLNVSSDPLQPCAIGSHVSFARTFAKSLLPSLGGEDVIVLVPTGISGTGFIDGVWPAYSGSGFKAAIAKLKRTWQLLHDGTHATDVEAQPAAAAPPAYNATFSGVLWHQGTCDAGDNSQHVAANASYHLNHNLVPLIASLRNSTLLPFTSPSLPFVLSQMLPSWMDNVTHPERAGVKEALAMVSQYVAYTGFADSYGLLGDPVFLSGSDHEVVHFTARSQRLLGKRYYTAYQAALVNYPEQPPSSSTLSFNRRFAAAVRVPQQSARVH